MDFFNEEEIFGTDAGQHLINSNILDDLKLDFDSEDEDLSIDDDTDQTTLLD